MCPDYNFDGKTKGSDCDECYDYVGRSLPHWISRQEMAPEGNEYGLPKSTDVGLREQTTPVLPGNSLHHLNEITNNNQGRHNATQFIFEMKS